MMAGLRSIFAAGANALRQLVGEAVSYRRGAAMATVTAVTAENVFELADSDGHIVLWHGRDFWIRTRDLVLDGQATTPQRGDQITDSDGHVFEVNAPSGADVYRYADPYNLELRIHTKEIQ